MKLIMKITIALICIFTLSIVVIGGCSLFKSKENYRNSKDWEQINNSETPWNSQGIHSEYWCHETHTFMAAGPTYYYYWLTKNGLLINRKKVIKQFDEYLIKSKLSDVWPDSNRSVGNRKIKSCPYRIFVTSIDPIIVLLVLTDKESEYLGAYSSVVYHKYVA